MASIQRPVRNQDILKFWNLHRHTIYKLCKRKMPRGVPIQDIMQNVYIRLHLHFENVRSLYSPVGWLVRVAENVCNDELRRLMRFRKASEKYCRYELQRNAKNARLPWDALEVKACLGKLPPQREALVDLHFLKGISIGDLAEVSGCKHTTVAKRLILSMEKMRKNALESVKMS